MKVRGQGAARRYARALLEVALEKNCAAEVRTEMRDVAELLRSNRELIGVLTHPTVSADRKTKIVATLFEARSRTKLVPRLLQLLVERQRVALLPEIETSFVSLWNAHRRVVAAESVSAAPLDPKTLDALGKSLQKATGMEVELATGVDPALLGGVLVRMGGRVYDGTIRARLKALRERLVRGTPGV